MFKRKKFFTSFILAIVLVVAITTVAYAGTWTKENYNVWLPGYETTREEDSELYAVPDNELFLATRDTGGTYYEARAYCDGCNTSASDSFYVFLDPNWYGEDIYFTHQGGCPLQLQLTSKTNTSEWHTGKYAIYEY